MRRSKSLSSKTVRRYRSVSQRRMTEFDNVDTEAEMAKLRHELAHNPLTQMEQQRKQEDTTTEAKSDDDNLDDILLADSEQGDEYGADDTPLIVVKKNKKTGTTTPAANVTLTPQEIKHHQQERKQRERKLRQLEQRQAQKNRRQQVLAKLEQHRLVLDKNDGNGNRHLFQSSAKLGQTQTKRERLKWLLDAERAGIELNAEQRAELYQDRNTVDDINNMNDHEDGDDKTLKTRAKDTQKTEQQPPPSKKVKTNNDSDTSNNNNTSTTQPQAPSSFAAQMMASLQKLKQAPAQTTFQKESDTNTDRFNGLQTTSTSVATTNSNKQKKKKDPYVPTEPTVLKTAAALGLPAVPSPRKSLSNDDHLLPPPIQRPAQLEQTRQSLPVNAMEFEIMDAVKNHDVTILCGETGSGKSTQVPQFLYEHGLAGISGSSGGGDGRQVVGITQPRRVAAVSTAQRVAYEMNAPLTATSSRKRHRGSTNNNNNLVAYQTRYETAGLGTATKLKFMTDGILLQEIQSDLLLRQYSVIVLDEAHERNLNTDVLLGLLSVALPLRRKAAQEDGSTLKPLKVIIMSATLRVEDFTKNDKLFANSTKTVVQVPGRTFPVTVHHAKTTELDDYHEAALAKVLKIHRKLPAGGILVFLTGQQEIVRMVKELDRKLNPQQSKKRRNEQPTHNVTLDVSQKSTLRDMDDEEIDGDIFQEDAVDDFDEMQEMEKDDDKEEEVVVPQAKDDEESSIPQKAVILPLYSLLSTEDQAKVFQPVPEGHRLIVVATNIAETVSAHPLRLSGLWLSWSITIPGISYVVDTGRQKCRNYDSGTGVASYDVMWISKAAADQRAGRAGRTGPGHCYRLYSSSLYSRQMDPFALPEVLTRPLEDVVLAMKAMRISNVSNFPFPTPPDRRQLDSAVKLLADLACLDTSNDLGDGSTDGEITKLGAAAAQLPLGVRYGKMVLVAADAGVLDYAIAVVSALSENSPFVTSTTVSSEERDGEDSDSGEDTPEGNKTKKPKQKGFWLHKGGDMLATVLAIGAYTHAGRNAGGAAQRLACRKFCEHHGLNPVIMARIHDMRLRLTRLLMSRLVKDSTNKLELRDKFHSLRPPNKLQERLLVQSIASGLLDHVATLAPVATFSDDHPLNLRSAFLGSTTDAQEPLFLDRNSVLYNGETRQLPKWVCYDTLVRTTHQKSGQTVVTMKGVTSLDPSWLGILSKGSRLLHLGAPLASPMPQFNSDQDTMLCAVTTKYGRHSWEIAPVRVPWQQAFVSQSTHRAISSDDLYAWFARFLLEGKVLPEFDALRGMLRQEAAVLTNSKIRPKSVQGLVLSAQSADLNCRQKLLSAWRDRGPRFLWSSIQPLVRTERVTEAERLWVTTARQYLAAV
eukprot:scaffold4042_cov165-Amphora_coffeaeformis.AAC.5